MLSRRERAIKWWEGLNNHTDLTNNPTKHQYLSTFYPNRRMESLTGFEIEQIWTLEKINRKNSVTWWFNLSDENRLRLLQSRGYNQSTTISDFVTQELYDWVLSVTPQL